MDRKDYWNKEYTDYWKNVTSEAEDKASYDSRVKKISGHDFTVPDIEVAISLFNKVRYECKEKLLDYGCGFGRFYPYFETKCEYYGIDISQFMIEECRKQFPGISDRFILAEGENLPFKDGFFDKIICYGVFDACYQEQALAEMLRVVKQGGSILVTGKADHYFVDDEEAYIAEKNARMKGHPNYFTDVSKMLDQLSKCSNVEHALFSLRRGDFSKKKFESVMPERFYEWFMIINKTTSGKPVFGKFSNDYSRTWYERE